MPRPRHMKKYVIEATVRFAPNWETERTRVFIQKAYSIERAREKARKRLIDLNAFTGPIDAIQYDLATKDRLAELYRQEGIRKRQGTFLWVGKRKKIVVRPSLSKVHFVGLRAVS